MLFYEAAQVQHICLRELFLHLVQLVGAHSVQITSVQLLLENLGHAKVIQIRGGAL